MSLSSWAENWPTSIMNLGQTHNLLVRRVAVEADAEPATGRRRLAPRHRGMRRGRARTAPRAAEERRRRPWPSAPGRHCSPSCPFRTSPSVRSGGVDAAAKQSVPLRPFTMVASAQWRRCSFFDERSGPVAGQHERWPRPGIAEASADYHRVQDPTRMGPAAKCASPTGPGLRRGDMPRALARRLDASGLHLLGPGLPALDRHGRLDPSRRGALAPVAINRLVKSYARARPRSLRRSLVAGRAGNLCR